jgi:small nuclear ribonucleoprotein (snRNP)-like protein
LISFSRAAKHSVANHLFQAIAAFPDVADFSDSNLYHQHYFPGAVSLFEDLDKDVMLDLRDGRKIFGTFRSFDQVSFCHICIYSDLLVVLSQFANIMLERCVERLYDSACPIFISTSSHLQFLPQPSPIR